MNNHKPSLQHMLNIIALEAEYTASLTGRAAFSAKVMQAMADVERANFVPDHSRAFAYEDGPLPIGFGQTISQPYIVALFTDLLDLETGHSVLEVGTGSGYQSAILAKLAGQVFTIERVKALFSDATQRLQQLGYHNIETCCGNGYQGWPEKAPFDRIVVTAAAPYIPPALLDQLKPEGRMVIPIGLPYQCQQLMLITKDRQHQIESKPILSVAFVPLVDDEDKPNSVEG